MARPGPREDPVTHATRPRGSSCGMVTHGTSPFARGTLCIGERGMVASARPRGERDHEWWVRPVGWAALVVWLAIPILGLTAQSVAGRIVWNMAIASLPLFIVLVGYHRWRRICPLAFVNQIPVRLRRAGTRRVSARFEEHYYLAPLIIFGIALWLRLIWMNGDGVAIAMFFGLLSLFALAVGFVFTGKTWCHYVCPVSFVEKIYTEPRGLRETQNSQCARCTACKKACADIDQENGYWKEIDSPSKRAAYFAFPGLVFGFHLYYFLQAGTWDYYFGGNWTDEPGVILRAFLPGSDARTAGFFVVPAVPRALAAALTLVVCGVTSLVAFRLAERAVEGWLRRRGANVDAAHVRNIMFGVAAFVAFVAFYSFAGQPMLRQLPWLTAYTGVVVVLTAALFLVRRLGRTQRAFAEQTMARNIIKRWTWADTAPPSNLHDAYLIHTARTTERERMYAEVLEVYQDAVRDLLAEGIITRADVQRLENLRDQLHISRADHERVMAALAEEERLLLVDPAQHASTEKRLQLETYRRALEAQLERILTSADDDQDRYVQRLRLEFGVTPEEHRLVLDHLLGRDEGTLVRIARAVSLMQVSAHCMRLLLAHPSATNAALADLLQRQRDRGVERLLRALEYAPDEAPVRSMRAGLCSDSAGVRLAALSDLSAHLQPIAREALARSYEDAARQASTLVSLVDALHVCTFDADPFVRAVALFALAEGDAIDSETLHRLSSDAYPLVCETAAALTERRQDQPLPIVAKMVALRSVSIFASLGPHALEELARSTNECEFAAHEAVCVQGELGHEVFVLLSGEFNVIHGPTPDSAPIRTETTGAVIGEIAVLDAAPRSASVFAGPHGGRALRVDGIAFRRVLHMDPGVAEGVIHALTQRLRSMPSPPG